MSSINPYDISYVREPKEGEAFWTGNGWRAADVNLDLMIVLNRNHDVVHMYYGLAEDYLKILELRMTFIKGQIKLMKKFLARK